MCCNPVWLKSKEMLVPCGQCSECLYRRRNEWVFRLSHELITQKNQAIFLTFTYDDEHLPEDRQVSVRDCQLFMKRLRKYYPDKKLKYFIASEYGTRTRRPHYHAIIYGLTVDDTKKAKRLYANELYKNVWKNGFCYVDIVNIFVIRYVAKYIVKNFMETRRKDYINNMITPPFSLKSTGLGLEYLKRNINSFCYNESHPTSYGVVQTPRYYRKKLVELGYIPDDYYMYRYVNDILPNLSKNYYKELLEWLPGYNNKLYNYYDDNRNDCFHYYRMFDIKDGWAYCGEYKTHWFYDYLEMKKHKQVLMIKKIKASLKAHL